ncbi:MAG: M81 family metallopeptidase [Emcibacter sp.]|nr:M81 family metallopeptidase [Emcibacter sp.]
MKHERTVKRVFIAAFGAETNSFSVLPTTMKDFQASCLIRPEQKKWPAIANDGHSEFLKMTEKMGHRAIRGTLAYTTPAGPLTQLTYETLRDEIIKQLHDALPVDCVLLNLHGAMMADGYDDCEGDFLEKIRQIVGSQVPIGGLLDPHAHLSQKMIDSATILLAYKEYPHTDFAISARKLFKLIDQTTDGKLIPVMRHYDCHTMGAFPTITTPMREFVDQHLMQYPSPKILDCSLIHSFPWADTADAGVKSLVVTDNDEQLAESYAKAVADEFIKIRSQLIQNYDTIDTAFSAINQIKDFPAIIADVADNPGGGAASDATFILEQARKSRLEKIAFGIFWDPFIVDLAYAAGKGANLKIRLGGKASWFSGVPQDMDVEILELRDDAKQYFGDDGDQRSLPLGKAVAMRHGNIDIIVSNLRIQSLSPDCFTEFGLNLSDYTALVVKSTNHFQAAFSRISKNIYYVMTPGALTMDFTSFPYQKITHPMWPIDQ